MLDKKITETWLTNLRVAGKPDEYEAKSLLAKIGLDVPKGILLEADSDLDVSEIKFPCVAKVCSPDIIHKTDEGGLFLKLDKKSLVEAVNKLRQQFPHKPILIEEQIQYQHGEFILGGFVDPVFGPALMTGAGGIYTELYEDVAFRLAPCSTKEAERMIYELKSVALFHGFRGITLDIKSFSQVIAKISELILIFGEVFDQLDINPIVCTGS